MEVSTPEEFARRMKGIYEEFGGTEESHSDMDNLMCEVLNRL